ncbi:uncharacterized protein EKO05_0008458 [Ascochyta rabiei]|uniref:uncharacterized protein n=1 Tax=Didymella rabiei TaxID=5454 RepID=UPI002201924E|nr:uncharacterized protein EKO05_0008458 [Ascochyta rabiei]UPX18147.1 hypothetical protein EKO05_0008458 [Ascochyta rabiei]
MRGHPSDGACYASALLFVLLVACPKCSNTGDLTLCIVLAQLISQVANAYCCLFLRLFFLPRNF